MAECLILGSGDKSFDANATAANILSGKTAYVNGVKVTGSMPNRGTYAYAGSMGKGNDGTDYYAFNTAPEGCYYKVDKDWQPELRLAKSKVREYLNISAGNIKKDAVVGEITGTWYGNKACIAANSARGFGSGDATGSDEQSFTMPADGTVYYGGASAGHTTSKITLAIYKNGSVVNSRNMPDSNYWFRSSMVNQSFSAKKGDVIKVYAYAASGTCAMACIQAVIVY